MCNTILKNSIFSVDVDFSFIYDYELELRSNGKRYFRLTNSTLPYKVGGVFIHLDNLFNGDKLLGKYRIKLSIY